MTSKKKKRNIENIIPILEGNDLERSIHFYTKFLEFKLEWGGREGEKIYSLSKDGHSIVLSETGKLVLKSRIWFGLEDDSLFEKY